MKKIFEYLRLTLFVGGVLIGIQLPSYVDQYGKRLDAHWQESEVSVKEFKNDADKYFSGDIKALIDHYQKNSDQVINNGGRNIATLQDRNQLLTDARQRFFENQFSPYIQTIIQPVPDVRQETWESYSFTIVLNLFAITCGLISGFLIANSNLAFCSCKDCSNACSWFYISAGNISLSTKASASPILRLTILSAKVVSK